MLRGQPVCHGHLFREYVWPLVEEYDYRRCPGSAFRFTHNLSGSGDSLPIGVIFIPLDPVCGPKGRY